MDKCSACGLAYNPTDGCAKLTCRHLGEVFVERQICGNCLIKVLDFIYQKIEVNHG